MPPLLDLQVENVECIAPDHIKFDFLGKDSIRYENQVKVEDKVFKNVQLFMRETAGGGSECPGPCETVLYDCDQLSFHA